MISHIKDVVAGKTSLFRRRSSHWPRVRDEHLAKNGSCAACGSTEYLQVHHIKPFHMDPSLELEPTNLITLCEKPGPASCHCDIGHLGNYRRENPRVVEDAAERLAASK